MSAFWRGSFPSPSWRQPAWGWTGAAVQHICAAQLCNISGLLGVACLLQSGSSAQVQGHGVEFSCGPGDHPHPGKQPKQGAGVLNMGVLLFCWTLLEPFLGLTTTVFPFSCMRSSDSTFFLWLVVVVVIPYCPPQNKMYPGAESLGACQQPAAASCPERTMWDETMLTIG